MSVERELMQIEQELSVIRAECRGESDPVTVLRADYMLERARIAIHRLIDVRNDRRAHSRAS